MEEEFDYETLKEITEEDLIQMGVKIGSRRKILAALRTNVAAQSSPLALSSAEKNWTIECDESRDIIIIVINTFAIAMLSFICCTRQAKASMAPCIKACGTTPRLP